MPVKKLQIKPGVNRENTRYTTEGGWYECDKIRFRQGNPEKIGGWNRISSNTYNGVARSLLPWTTNSGERRIGVGTNTNYYIERNNSYNDITPIEASVALANDPLELFSFTPFLEITVPDATIFEVGQEIIISGATDVAGSDVNGTYNIDRIDTGTNKLSVSFPRIIPAPAGVGGGAGVTLDAILKPGPPITTATFGYGSGPYGSGKYGVSGSGAETLRIWNNSLFGKDLIIGPKNGSIYYWDASGGFPSRAVPLDTLPSASDVPEVQRLLLVSDASRFVFAFGCDEIGASTTQNPMLIRWSDQEQAQIWTPSATNQAGSIQLSRGSEIIAVQQARQEILVWTDTALYSLQYVGPPEVWSTQLVGENISVASDGAVAYSNGVAYWMGREKFYRYDGRAAPLSCDLRKFVFDNLNDTQYEQVFAGTNEQFYEIWWFYCVGGDQITNYVVYNYLERIWYYGTLGRTAWIDAGVNNNPIAATYNHNIVEHEDGIDDNETATPTPINAFILSSQLDIDDGHKFAFVRRVIPDVSFEGSTAQSPLINLSLLPLKGSGSGYNNPLSVGGQDNADTSRLLTVPVEQYTNQLFIRARGRQLSMKIESDGLGVQWQLGKPRLDMRPSGRK